MIRQMFMQPFLQSPEQNSVSLMVPFGKHIQLLSIGEPFLIFSLQAAEIRKMHCQLF